MGGSKGRTVSEGWHIFVFDCEFRELVDDSGKLREEEVKRVFQKYEIGVILKVCQSPIQP